MGKLYIWPNGLIFHQPRSVLSLLGNYCVRIFHQPRFPWNMGISLTFHHHLGAQVVFSVAIIWPDFFLLTFGEVARIIDFSQQRYCWWFRNPAFTSWYGSLAHYVQCFFPSQVGFSRKFLNHQQYHGWKSSLFDLIDWGWKKTKTCNKNIPNLGFLAWWIPRFKQAQPLKIKGASTGWQTPTPRFGWKLV